LFYAPDGAKWGEVGFEMTAFLPAFFVLDFSMNAYFSVNSSLTLRNLRMAATIQKTNNL
jgi:hypothetical protein